MNDIRDQLIDVILQKELAGEQPPDLTEPILARAFAKPRFKAAYVAVAVLAATVLISVSVAGWMLLLPDYPSPVIEGEYQIVSGGKIERGAVLRTQAKPAVLSLGGYCKVDIQSNTEVRLDGKDRAESVFMKSGEVQCKVDRTGGTFDVATPLGTVSTVGTQFTVRLRNEQLFVRVATGEVLVAGVWGKTRITAGSQRLFRVMADEGAVVAKGETWFTLKSDRDRRTRIYMPSWIGEINGGSLNLDIVEAIQRLKPGQLVVVDWKPEAHPVMTGLRRIEGPIKSEYPASRKSGKVAGKLTAKGKTWIEVQDDRKRLRRYMVELTDAPRDRQNPELVRLIADLPIGSLVLLEWKSTERRGVIGIKALP